MFGGKNKAVTFSFDDGITQDLRIIKILDKYGLIGTFNVNSGLLGQPGTLNRNNKTVSHNKLRPGEVRKISLNHEVAAHTLTHCNLTELNEEQIIYQVEQDRLNLCNICECDISGLAYACGGINNDDRVADIIKTKTGIKYARTITSTGKFSVQKNIFRFNPTTHFLETENTFKLANKFIELNGNEPLILYIWGHGFELDAYDLWDDFERLCKLLSAHNDIFFGTNSEVLTGC